MWRRLNVGNFIKFRTQQEINELIKKETKEKYDRLKEKIASRKKNRTDKLSSENDKSEIIEELAKIHEKELAEQRAFYEEEIRKLIGELQNITISNNKEKIVPKNPKKITTSNIDKDSKLSKQTDRLIKLLESYRD